MPGPASRAGAHVNLHWLKYMILTGESLDAEQARLAGLVQIVPPEGEHLVAAEGSGDADRRPRAARAGGGQGATRRRRRRPLEHAVDGVGTCRAATDFAEGIAAFGERRALRTSRGR